jgi:sarcosine oxidase subunit beta
MLERFPEEIGVSAELRQIGYLFLATTDAEAAQFARNVEVQRAAGLREVELLDVAGALELVPELRADDLVAATWCPTDGLAGPNEVTLGYAAAARRHGATLLEEIEVTGIDLEGEAVAAVCTTRRWWSTAPARTPPPWPGWPGWRCRSPPSVATSSSPRPSRSAGRCR